MSLTVKYSVVAPDGTRYGPVDLATLTQWVAEGRVLPQTMLEREDGQQMPASAVPDLQFASTQSAQPSQPQEPYAGPARTAYTSYPRQPVYGPGEVPPELQGGFNWGAFLLTWIWGLNHKAYLTLITLGLAIGGVVLNLAMNPGLASGGRTPGTMPTSNPLGIVLNIIQLGLMVWYGLMGNRWAWQSGRFSTVEECKRVQRVWGWWGLGVTVVCCGCALIAMVGGTMAMMGAMRR